jgi:hypothetical protein
VCVCVLRVGHANRLEWLKCYLGIRVGMLTPTTVPGPRVGGPAATTMRRAGWEAQQHSSSPTATATIAQGASGGLQHNRRLEIQ